MNVAQKEMRESLDYAVPVASKDAARNRILAGVLEPATRLWDFLTQRLNFS